MFELLQDLLLHAKHNDTEFYMKCKERLHGKMRINEKDSLTKAGLRVEKTWKLHVQGDSGRNGTVRHPGT